VFSVSYFFDKDHSGQLDKKEMMAVFAQSFENYGAPIEQRDLDRIFAKFDKDRSGKINFDEFCVMMLSRLKM
jgi:Ca2+-binding EF-hand superfamily protein